MVNHELKKTRLGGSEASIPIEAHPYLKPYPFWLYKTGRVPRPEPTLDQTIGKLAEGFCLSIFTEMTGKEVIYSDETIVDPDRPWMAATPDAYVAGEQAGVEVKFVTWPNRRQWDEDMPWYVRIQCRWDMAVTRLSKWYVFALVAGVPQIYEVEPDPVADPVMIEIGRKWVDDHLIHDIEPPMTVSKATSEWLQRQFPTHKQPDLIQPGPGEMQLLAEYEALRRDERDLKKRRGEMEMFLKKAIGGHEGFLWENGKFTWRKTKDSKWMDWESLSWALLTHYVEDRAEREKLVADYEKTKPGKRRIYFDSELMHEQPEEESEVADV